MLSQPIVLALLSMVCKILGDFIYKLAAGDKEGKYIKLFYTMESITIMLIMSILWIPGIFKIQMNLKGIIYGSIIGLITFIGYNLFLKGLRRGDGASNITIFRLNFIVASALAIILLNESLNLKKIIGIVLCIITIAIFAGKNNKGKEGKEGSDKSYLYSILSCTVIGIGSIVNKVAVSDNIRIDTILFCRYATVLILVMSFFHFKDLNINLKNGQIPSKQIFMGIISGIIMLVSLYFMYSAYKIGDILIVAPIIQLSFVFTSILCVVFLKEKLGIRKIVSLFFAVLSIIVISL